MMKVYSDHGNIHTLKIAIAAELAGEKTSFVDTKQDGNDSIIQWFIADNALVYKLWHM